MRKILGVLAFGLLLAGAASAQVPEKVYYVGAGGNDSRDGRSYSNRWASITKANNTVQTTVDSNVVVNVYPGNYTTSPNPVNLADPARRIAFYGNVTDRSTTTIPTVSLVDPRITIRGFTVNGSVGIQPPAVRDSFADCIVLTGMSLDGVDSTMIQRVWIKNGKFKIQRNTAIAKANAIADTVKDCRFDLDGNGSEPGFYLGTTPCNGCPGTSRRYLDGWVFSRNRITVTSSGTNASTLRKFFHVRNTTFDHNKWTLTCNATGGDEFYFTTMIRDSSINVRFIADTLLGMGTGRQWNVLAGPGSYINSVEGIVMDSCYIAMAHGEPALEFMSPANGCSLTYNTVISQEGTALLVAGVRGRNVIDHNTFISGKNGYFNPSDLGIVNFPSTAWANVTDTTLFTNNILMSIAPPQFGGTTYNTERTYLMGNEFSPVSPTLTNYRNFVKSDWNLYCMNRYMATPGDRSIGWKTDGTVTGSHPGNAKPWENMVPKHDSLSTWGNAEFDRGGPDTVWYNPLFPQPGADSLFNPQIGINSHARGAGKNGTDIGAVSYEPYPIMSLSDDNMIFSVGEEGIGRTDTLEIQITNIGSNELVLSNLVVPWGGITTPPGGPPEPGNTITGFFTDATIAGSATAQLVVTMTYGNDTTAEYYLTFDTNDPVHPHVTIGIFVNGRGGGVIDL